MTDDVSTHDPAGTPPPGDSLKSQTSRISLGSARVPRAAPDAKKSTGLVPGIPAHAGPIPQTIRLKRPPTSPIAVPSVNLPPAAKKHGDTALVQPSAHAQATTAETVKRQTSRIGLASPPAAPKNIADLKRSTGPILGIPTHAGPIPQTIRLKRPPTSPVMRPPTAPVQTARPPAVPATPNGLLPITEAQTIIRHTAAPRSPTSRIVLEEAAGPASAALPKPAAQIPPLAQEESLSPKTIRLKRPSSLSDADETIPVTAADASRQASKKGETAKIELPLEDSSLTPITQRKTIKIKRTSAGPAAPRAAAPEPVVRPEPGARAPAPAPDEQEIIVFPLVALAATFCIAALVYIMAAQALGVHLPLPSSMPLH